MGDYYPTLTELKQLSSESESILPSDEFQQIKPGFLKRTDGFDVDGTLNMLEQKNVDGLHDGLISRMKSVSDLTMSLYDEFSKNPNSIGNWFPEVTKAVEKTDGSFKLPSTKIWKLPIEVAQFLRVEYQDTTEASKRLFNKMIYKVFGLSNDKEYFIKTGTFSSKFEFRNAHIAKGEADEMGEYFQVVNNFAMTVGAGHSVEVCIRDYIEDVEGNPTIYSGMPLRTEFRAFVDFDKNEIIGVVPYWNPLVMKRAFSSEYAPSTIKRDYKTYCDHENKMMNEYNEWLGEVKSGLKVLIPHVELSGRYSVDIMKNGKDLYLIDMATMESSALTELLD